MRRLARAAVLMLAAALSPGEAAAQSVTEIELTKGWISLGVEGGGRVEMTPGSHVRVDAGAGGPAVVEVLSGAANVSSALAPGGVVELQMAGRRFELRAASAMIRAEGPEMSATLMYGAGLFGEGMAMERPGAQMLMGPEGMRPATASPSEMREMGRMLAGPQRAPPPPPPPPPGGPGERMIGIDSMAPGAVAPAPPMGMGRDAPEMRRRRGMGPMEDMGMDGMGMDGGDMEAMKPPPPR